MLTRKNEGGFVDLRALPQWVCWKSVDSAGKPTKVPVHPRFGWNASATDPSTWTTFEEAVEASDRYAGVGFVFTENDPFAGLDLDNCLDEHGNLVWGDYLIASFNTEISLSGRGVKLFLRDRKPEWARCKAGGFGPDGNGTVEIYDRARWFAVTGRPWPGTPAGVEDRQEQLDALCGRLWPRTEASVPDPSLPATTARRGASTPCCGWRWPTAAMARTGCTRRRAGARSTI